MPAVKPTPTDIADAITKCEAGPDPVSGEYEFPDYQDAGLHWFCFLYDPEGKLVSVVELVRRQIRRLTNDELNQVRLEIETLLCERLGHV